MSSHRGHVGRIVCALVVLIVTSGPALGQSTWHVAAAAAGDPGPGDTSVSDPSEDGTEAHPFDAIQEAIDASVDGDTVLILDGTYTGDGNRDIDFGGRAITVRSQNGPDTCVIDCEAGGRGFVFQSQEDRDTVLEGVTITGADTLPEIGSGDQLGDGIVVIGTSPTIRGCRIADNHSSGASGDEEALGGGIGSIDGSLLIEDCVVEDNGATRGGGIYILRGEAMIVNCTIRRNNADEGGAGIYTEGGAPIIRGCTISENDVNGVGAVYCVGGGGIACVGGTPTIEDSTINTNHSDYCIGAGGIYCSGEGEIRNCEMRGNTAIESPGAGLYSAGDLRVSECRMVENWGLGGATDGCGVFHKEGTLRLTNCLIAGNHNSPDSASNTGVGLHFRDAVVLTNCTLADNIERAHFDGDRTLNIRGDDGTVLIANNCIIWGDETIELPVGAIVTYSDVSGGLAGEGNIDADPRFVDPEAGDYHLQDGSPCVNAGSDDVADLPEIDLDGAARIQFCRVDMGAYESSFG